MMFLERLIQTGMKDNPIYYSLEYSWFAKDDLWLPNCTAFACSRSSEAAGRNVKQQIPRTNAQTWYEKSNWRGSAVPQVGAIAVWGGGKYGHVGIVERINEDGSVVISQSNYTRASKEAMIANYFVLGTYRPIVGEVTKYIGWTFLGYLINPYINDIRTKRDPAKHQIDVTKEKVRARKGPNGEIYSGLFIPMGLYDVLEEDGDWVRVDDNVWFSKGDWTTDYPAEKKEEEVMPELVKIVKDPNYNYRWSLDGNRYGDKYDVTVMGGFGDEMLKADGWEEVLAVNGSLFYTYEGKHYAHGVEKSRGEINQELEMSCVTDSNEVMALGMDYNGGLAFKKTKDICAEIWEYYGAVTGEFGIMKDGQKAEWGKEVFTQQYNDISGRTIIGTDKEGNYLSYSLAGVSGSSGKRGAELYDLCKKLGFWNAICFDGGGSVFRRVNGVKDITTTRKVKNCVLLYRKKRNVEEELAKMKTALEEAEKGLKTMTQKYDEVCRFNVKLTAENEGLRNDIHLLTDTNNKLLSAYGEINKILKGVI
ncbi:MAG: phosphodiester glycosidase family protein [Firmicutes bacterium]|nr:phosphodiester glycosidase family protein [Bacillota bacterium]